jgi:CBS domain-containing protein
MTTVRHVLQSKSSGTWTISPDATVYEALQLMAEKNIGALLAVDGEGHLAGIFSERDYARRGILAGRHSKDTPIGQVMTSKVYYVAPDQSADECMALMTEKHIRHLPVFENGNLLGVISIGDVVRTVIEDREFVIQNLEKYISGAR